MAASFRFGVSRQSCRTNCAMSVSVFTLFSCPWLKHQRTFRLPSHSSSPPRRLSHERRAPARTLGGCIFDFARVVETYLGAADKHSNAVFFNGLRKRCRDQAIELDRGVHTDLCRGCVRDAGGGRQRAEEATVGGQRGAVCNRIRRAGAPERASDAQKGVHRAARPRFSSVTQAFGRRHRRIRESGVAVGWRAPRSREG